MSENSWDYRIRCNNEKCDYYINLKRDNLKNFFDKKYGTEIFKDKKKYNANIFSYVYDDLMCGKCESFPLHIIDNKFEYLLHPDKIKICENCDLPIILLRLKLNKGTKLCGYCAQKREDMSEIEKIKIFNDKAMPKSPPIPDNLKVCEKCGELATTRYTSSTETWFVGCSTFPKCWWKRPLPQIGKIKGANISFNMKGLALELLNAAKEAAKTNNIIVLKEIYEEMIYRQERRKDRGKKRNRKLDEYAEAVLRYIKDLEK